MGGVMSRNGRTRRIQSDRDVSMKEKMSDLHEREVSHADFFSSVDSEGDRRTTFKEHRNHCEVRCMHVESDRKGGTVLYNAG